GADSGNVPAATVHEYGSDAVISANTGSLARTGFGFDNWNTSPDGSGTLYAPGQTVPMISGSMVLYARWSGFHISYHGKAVIDAGVVPDDPDTHGAGDTIAVIDYEDIGFTGNIVNGYNFMGWDTSPAARTVVYGPGTSFPMPAVDLDLYAVWRGVIENEADLRAITVMDIEYYLIASFVMSNDPLTVFEQPFSGVFDGNDNTIGNLHISVTDGTSNHGMFGHLTGEVRDLVLENVSIVCTNTSVVGALVGLNEGTVDNCDVLSGNVTVTGSATQTGGLAGVNMPGGTIRNCNAGVNVSNASNAVGGFVGQNYGDIGYCNVTSAAAVIINGGNESSGGFAGICRDAGILDHCTVGSTVVVNGEDCVGGLVGQCIYGGSISNCTVSADSVNGTANFVGGLLGLCQNSDVIISDCTVNDAAVDGDGDSVGGLAGGILSTVNSASISGCTVALSSCSGNMYVGGLIGVFGADNGTIENCAVIDDSTGNITGSMYVGGLVGDLNNTVGSNSLHVSGCTVSLEGQVFSVSGSVGGLIGRILTNVESFAISDCDVEVDVISGSGPCAGGLIGENINSGSGTVSISYCEVSGVIDGGGSDYIGGLIGLNENSEISDCGFLGGSITGGHYTGGFVGQNDGGSLTGCMVYSVTTVSGTGISGGFIGYNLSAMEISDCDSMADVDCTGDDVGGFVGRNDSVIRTSNASGGVECAGSSCGGFAGRNTVDGNISECAALGNVAGDTSVGGFAGYNLGEISHSYAEGQVQIENYTGGGFAGINDGADALISHCYSGGEVHDTGTDAGYTGGFVGLCQNGCQIEYCYETGAVYAVQSTIGVIPVNCTGGFAGGISSGNSIEFCYSSGNVDDNSTDTSFAGGFTAIIADVLSVAYCHANGNVTFNDLNTYAGGFAGYNNQMINYCYSRGILSGGAIQYAFLGLAPSGSIAGNCVYLSDAFGPGGNDTGRPRTEVLMRLESTYTDINIGWDFDDIWAIDGVTNGGFPYLLGLDY
ncbi:MAG: InlB B-repeat-containing protein, partial [Spirochaetales bacterium]|nr:InlB B-repeat-containing protein [Spirochaetales bacterium]